MDADSTKRESDTATDEDDTGMSVLVAATQALRVLSDPTNGLHDETLHTNDVQERLFFTRPSEAESSHTDSEERGLERSHLASAGDNGRNRRPHEYNLYGQVYNSVTEAVPRSECGSSDSIYVEALSSSDATTRPATNSAGQLSSDVSESSKRGSKRRHRHGVTKKTSKRAPAGVPDRTFERPPEATSSEAPTRARARTTQLTPTGRTKRFLQFIRGRAPQQTGQHMTEGPSATATSPTNSEPQSVDIPVSPIENTSEAHVHSNLESGRTKQKGVVSEGKHTPSSIISLPSTASKEVPESSRHDSEAARSVSRSPNDVDLIIQQRLSTVVSKAHSARPGSADMPYGSVRTCSRMPQRPILNEVQAQPSLNVRGFAETSRPLSRWWNAFRGISRSSSVAQELTAQNNRGFLSRDQAGPTVNDVAQASICEPHSKTTELSLPIKKAKKKKASLASRFPTLRAILQRPPLNENLQQDPLVSSTTPEEEYPPLQENLPSRIRRTAEASNLLPNCKENLPPSVRERAPGPQQPAPLSPGPTLVLPDTRLQTPNSTTSVPGLIEASGRGNAGGRRAPPKKGSNPRSSRSGRQSTSLSSASDGRMQHASGVGSGTDPATSQGQEQDTQWDQDFQRMLRRYLPQELLLCAAPRTRDDPKKQHSEQQPDATETRGQPSRQQASTQRASKQPCTVPQSASASSTAQLVEQASAVGSESPSATKQGDGHDPEWEREFQVMLRRYLPRELLECTAPTASNQPQGHQQQPQSDTAGTREESGRDSPWEKKFQRMLRQYLPRELLERTAPSAQGRQQHEQRPETAGTSPECSESAFGHPVDLSPATQARVFAESVLPWSAFVPGREVSQTRLLQKRLPSVKPVSSLACMPEQGSDERLRATEQRQPSTSRESLHVRQGHGVSDPGQGSTAHIFPQTSSYPDRAVTSTQHTETDDDDDSMPDLETPSPVHSPPQSDAPDPQPSHGGLTETAFQPQNPTQPLSHAQPLQASQFAPTHQWQGEPGYTPLATPTLPHPTSTAARTLTNQQLLQSGFHAAPYAQQGYATLPPIQMPHPAHRSEIHRPLLNVPTAPGSYVAPSRYWGPMIRPEAQQVFQLPLRDSSPCHFSNVNLAPFRAPFQGFQRPQAAPSSFMEYVLNARVRRHSSHETQANRPQSLRQLLTTSRQAASEPDICPLTPTEKSDASDWSPFTLPALGHFPMDVRHGALELPKPGADTSKEELEEEKPESFVEESKSPPDDADTSGQERSATKQKRKPPFAGSRTKSEEALETPEKKFQQSPPDAASSDRYPLRPTQYRSKRRVSSTTAKKGRAKVEAKAEAELEEQSVAEAEKAGSSLEAETKPSSKEQPSDLQLGASSHPRATSLEASFFPERAVPPSVFYFRDVPSDDPRSELTRFVEDIWPV